MSSGPEQDCDAASDASEHGLSEHGQKERSQACGAHPQIEMPPIVPIVMPPPMPAAADDKDAVPDLGSV